MTVGAKGGREKPPAVNRGDVAVYEGTDRGQVTSWIPQRDSKAGLELTILLDDGAGSDLATQLNDIRAFIMSQPATTAIAVGYMRNGTVQFTSRLTNNHPI